MKSIRITRWLLALTAAAMGMGVATKAEAIQVAPPYYTETTALANAPQGTPLSGYFTFPSNSNVKTNSAKVVSATSPVSGLTNDAVQITANSPSQTGAVWSTKASFDLQHNQTASMWIFASGALNKTPGDGMAFVLQNGDTSQFSDNGEALGVWGTDPESKTSDPAALANTAIPNSWALEFDTYKNDFEPTSSILNVSDWNLDKADPSSFDLGTASDSGTQSTIGGPHIAANYPGEASTYQPMGPKYGYKAGDIAGILHASQYYYYGMTHLGYISTSNNLANNAWHHITLNYQAPTAVGGNGTMTYNYDDKDPATGLAKTATATRSVPINLSKFNLSGGQSAIRWGFTGSTGEMSETNLVVFDQIPGQTKTTATTAMTYMKDGQPVTVNNGDTIPGGADVTLNYTAQRQSGDADWQGLNAELQAPNNLNLADTATVSYADGTTRKVTIAKQTDGYIRVNLAKDGSDTGLSLANQDAVKIAITGKSRNPTSGTLSSGTGLTNYFKGSNAVSTVASPTFTIAHADINMLRLVPDSQTVHVNLGETPRVTGKVVSGDGSALDNSDLTLRGWTKNEANVNYKLPDMKLSDANPASGFTFDISGAFLTTTPGRYSLHLEVSDSPGNLSSADITIIVGDLTFGETSGDLSYRAPLTGSTQIIQRADPNWTFKINDSLAKDSDWKLYARASALTSTTTPGTTLDGQLIFQNGGVEQPLSATTDTLITDHPSDGTTTPVDIAGDWDQNSGILLKVNGGAQVGDYQGTVTWTLSNTDS
ncbi:MULTISPECIES: hypothetical protein [Lactobacillaceae]|uniref:lectin-like domain-containing protein n=1 Tax=Lactobacillaceae TaxID=33958 RepID=UPI001457390B|nr:hypothetical protein [Lactobacillus sp. HBUAS51381]NLR08921.1 hypothetical protein [Lactobacillus sp. HBUAS51381]